MIQVKYSNLVNVGLITGTKAQFNTACTNGDFLFVGDITQYTDEMSQDAVGSILLNSSKITFTYSDVTPSISADIVPNSITAVELSNTINISEFVNDVGYVTASVIDTLVQDLQTLADDMIALAVAL
jgi:hypothetical protein